MCGVIGLWRPRRGDDDADGARADVAARLDRIRHRGPDGRAIWHGASGDGVITLGLARLGIVARETPAAVAVDVGRGGDDVIAAVTNGELYNHAALRRRLADQRPPGVDDVDDVDTALVPALFRSLGPAWAREARGMFGAIVAAGSRLHLFRDPLGKKPLFYRRRGDGWIVASEQKALFGAGDSPPTVDPVRADRAFIRGFLDDDEPFLRDVHQVPPGGHVVLDGRGATVGRAVAFDEAQGDRRGGSDDDAFDRDVERLEALVAKATRRRAKTMVPTRMLLSGGMDAAVVLAAADGLGASTLAMPGDRDESPGARRVARRLGRGWDVVTPTPPDPARLRRVLWHTEVPDVAASWAMGSALLDHAAALAADGVRVVLSGEGADELFLGYPWQRLDAGVLRGKRHDDLVVRAARARQRDPGDRAFVRWRRMLEAPVEPALDSARPRLFPEVGSPPTTTMTTVLATPVASSTTGPHRARALQLEALQHDMLTLPVLHADRLWMAHGIEARLPFLDVDLVRAALRLPAASLLSTRVEKPLVRQLFQRAFSRPAPAKRGFSGARRPDDDGVRALVDTVLRRGARVVSGSALQRLRQGADDRRVVELLWRVVVIEECADVLCGGGP